jgi:hypothetical protein
VPKPEGLAVGRVVHYTPEPALDGTPMVLRNGPIGGRISAVMSTETGLCYLHLDVVPDHHYLPSLGDLVSAFNGSAPKTCQVTSAPYDPDGKPGTWRYPPRA